ncbi:class I adenylate-forming enzyme family protein [Nesterenkonia sp. HG001]|uniref:class I adenylate-forming enzyme family protein n=1 Tax=Nesterenkonia sp. HG001 TaxID=2983207 RepID=UPI002AC7634D|nr:AMP-binding protein [Nesterenkonia sp. HG001]MDZ5078880.1 AMP-binding protein [Nesterenkonia sp. HG001]
MDAPIHQTVDAHRFVHGPAIPEQLRRRAATDPDQVYAVEGEKIITLAELDLLVDNITELLETLEVDPGSRVGVGLSTTVQHAATILALFRRGALWVPVNPQLKGLPLAHQMDDAQVTHMVLEADSDFARRVAETASIARDLDLGGGAVLWQLPREDPPEPLPDAELLMYTSGTTGPPKGVKVSATMLRACVLGTMHVTEVRRGDVLYLWEPLFHIGGAQTMLLPLYAEVHLVFAPRFSASRFWSDVTHHGVTHVHYLGGVLQILLQLPVSAEEQHHGVRVAWGAGATPALWQAAQERFGFALHECYGSTETSSIVTVNKNVSAGGVGSPLPWFEVDLLSSSVNGGGQGEVTVRSHIPGLITSGYLNRPEATSRSSTADGWFVTGDLGHLDDRGQLHFDGRTSDAVRIRGENVSTWQVENVFSQHPAVDRCAVIGVEAEIGEQEMLLFLEPADAEAFDPREVLHWGAQHLARFQLPRYVRVIDQMPLTPSQRVSKHQLPRGLEDALEP